MAFFVPTLNPDPDKEEFYKHHNDQTRAERSILSFAILETLFSTFVPQVLSKWLSRKNEQREQAARLVKEHREKVIRLVDELQQTTLGWLATLAEGQQELNPNAAHIYAFESALNRLEHELTDEQKSSLTAYCLNLFNLRDIQQAQRELHQLRRQPLLRASSRAARP